MGLMEGFIFSLVAYFDMKREQKKEQMAAGTTAKKYDSFAVEKAYLQSKNTMIPEVYEQLDLSFFDSETDFSESTYETVDGNSFSEETKERLRYLYALVHADPCSIEKRTELIQELLRVKQTMFEPTEHLIHNELLYVIDMYHAQNNRDRLVQHLCMMLDAEYYLMKGDYLNALKRYYKVLNWDEVLKNGRIHENLDANGLESLYEAAVINIINIYALLGLREKAAETREKFKFIYNVTQHIMLGGSSPDGNQELYNSVMMYQVKIREAFYAEDEPKGFFIFGDNALQNKNMFMSCYLGNFGGVDGYFLTIGLEYNLDTVDVAGLRDGKFGAYPSLRIGSFGCIVDAKYKAQKQLDDIKATF